MTPIKPITPAKLTPIEQRIETIINVLIFRVFTFTPRLLALSSPNLRAVSLWLSFIIIIKDTKKDRRRIIISFGLVFDTEPKSQKTIDERVSSVDMYCIRLVRESKKNFTAIPARIIELVLAKFLLDIKYTKIIAISAKPIAPTGIKFIENPRRRKKDAPKPAAEDTPRVNGDASGLSRIVCIQAPASPKISPKIRAVVISGILILKRIVL